MVVLRVGCVKHRFPFLFYLLCAFFRSLVLGSFSSSPIKLRVDLSSVPLPYRCFRVYFKKIPYHGQCSALPRPNIPRLARSDADSSSGSIYWDQSFFTACHRRSWISMYLLTIPILNYSVPRIVSIGSGFLRSGRWSNINRSLSNGLLSFSVGEDPNRALSTSL